MAIYSQLHYRFSVPSKLQLQCELDRAGSADLVERVETATRAAGAQTVRQCLGRAAKQRTGEVVVGTAEVGMVKDIEELCSETKFYLFGEAKLPLQAKIELRSSETAQNVATETTLLPSGRRGKGRLI